MNDRELILETQDAPVWALTLSAVEATVGVEPVTFRCRSGGCELAHAGQTRDGPLFMSSWAVERDLDFEVIINGRKLNRRAAIKARDRFVPLESTSGRQIDHQEKTGCISLLLVPPGMAEDFPDLMVRCRHGDAVLDRYEVLASIRTGRARKVAVGLPRLRYVRPTMGGSTVSTATETRTLGMADGAPLEP